MSPVLDAASASSGTRKGPAAHRIALESLPSGVARGVVATEAVVEHRARVGVDRPAACGRLAVTVASISSDAGASWPRQAASIIRRSASRGFRVTSAIRRSSSIISAAVVNSPARRWLLARKLSASCKLHERARVAGELRLASGQEHARLRHPTARRRRERWLFHRRARASGPLRRWLTFNARTISSARLSIGAAAAYPSVNRSANASSRTSTARGGSGPGGAARAASAASTTPPGISRSAAIAAPSASRCVSRAKSASSGSRRLAALTSSRPASPERRCSNAICPRKRSTRARWSSSSGAGLDRDQQSQCRVERAGVALRPGSREQPLRTASGFGRQHRRALEERGRGGEAPARLRSAGRALEFLGDVLVGRRARPAPGARRGGRDRSPDR